MDLLSVSRGEKKKRKKKRISAAVMLRAASAVMRFVSDARVLLYIQLQSGCELVTSDYSRRALCEKGSNHLLAAVLKSACKIVKPSSSRQCRSCSREFLRQQQIIIQSFTQQT